MERNGERMGELGICAMTDRMPHEYNRPTTAKWVRGAYNLGICRDSLSGNNTRVPETGTPDDGTWTAAIGGCPSHRCAMESFLTPPSSYSRRRIDRLLFCAYNVKGRAILRNHSAYFNYAPSRPTKTPLAPLRRHQLVPHMFVRLPLPFQLLPFPRIRPAHTPLDRSPRRSFSFFFAYHSIMVQHAREATP